MFSTGHIASKFVVLCWLQHSHYRGMGMDTDSLLSQVCNCEALWRDGGHQKVASMINCFNLEFWLLWLGLPGFPSCHRNMYEDLTKKGKDRNLGKAVVFGGQSLILSR